MMRAPFTSIELMYAMSIYVAADDPSYSRVTTRHPLHWRPIDRDSRLDRRSLRNVFVFFLAENPLEPPLSRSRPRSGQSIEFYGPDTLRSYPLRPHIALVRYGSLGEHNALLTAVEPASSIPQAPDGNGPGSGLSWPWPVLRSRCERKGLRNIAKRSDILSHYPTI
jgi:hypothetical protein